MPRKPRIMSPTGIYHVILRSVNQHIIFEDESDYRKFIYILSDCKEKYNIDIYAYCLMDNHVHLLLYSQPDKLSVFFQSLGTRFAIWYNKKYSRSGHLFQDRFYSTIIESDQYFLSVLAYIHNNPVNANVCRHPSEYRWSSFNAYYDAKNPLTNTSFACNVAGSKDSLHKFFANENISSSSYLFDDIDEKKKNFVSDKKAIEIFKDVTNLSSTSDVNKLNKLERNVYIRLLRDKGLTVKQVSRIMDISQATVKRITSWNSKK